MEPLHFRPTEDRAVAIDNQIACAHGRLIPCAAGGGEAAADFFGLARVGSRRIDFEFGSFCARDKPCDVCVWRGLRVLLTHADDL